MARLHYRGGQWTCTHLHRCSNGPTPDARSPTLTGSNVDDDSLATDLARAGLGVNYWILGHGKHGWYGIVKDAFAMRDAALEIPPGPIETQLRAAGRTMNSQGEDLAELHVDVTRKGLSGLKVDGSQILAAVAPTLAGLDEDAAAQARTWLMGIGARIANASRDDFRGKKVSDDERLALDQLATWLEDPVAGPLDA